MSQATVDFDLDPPSMLLPRGDLYGDSTAFSWYTDQNWKTYSYREAAQFVLNWSSHLSNLGVKPRDRVALLSESRPEWAFSFYAIMRVGGIVVPLDSKSTISELSVNLMDCAPKILICSAAFFPIAEQIKERVGSILEIVVMEEVRECDTNAHFPTLEEEDTALILYTHQFDLNSSPRGVMISYRTLLYQTEELIHKMGLQKSEVFLSVLPLYQLFELTCSLLTGIRSGAHICFTSSLYSEDLLSTIRLKKVTRMTTGPLFLKLIKNAFDRHLEKAGRLERFLFSKCVRWGRHVRSRRLKRFILFRTHEIFGLHFREFFALGSPLETGLVKFFENIGIPVYHAYGMTEAGPVISTNNHRHHKLGSLGFPLPRTELKILKEANGSDGEICVRGPHVMKGYFNQPTLTGEKLDREGWFHTGDMGHIDNEGFLFITGSKKLPKTRERPNAKEGIRSDWSTEARRKEPRI